MEDIESRSEALALRLACYCSANGNLSLARLAAHTWRHLWFYSGHPNVRTGTMVGLRSHSTILYHNFGIRLLSRVSLDKSRVRFIAMRDCLEEEIDGDYPILSNWWQPLPNTLAMECILCGDPDRLDALDVALLEEEVVCSQNPTVNAFQYAASLGDLDCFAVLLKKLGVTSSLMVDPDGKLSLDVLACCDARFPFGNREGILHYLLNHFTLDSSRAQSLLESASLFGAPWMLSLVFSHLERKGNPVAVEQLDCALFLACREGYTECVRMLLEHGADVNAEDENYNAQDLNGSTPLCRAAAGGHTDCARLLLEHGADANGSDVVDTLSVLMLAVWGGHTDCARVLLEYGADANDQDEASDWTVLMFAAHGKHMDCVRLLLEHID